jgi:hypothetical protein
MTDARDLAHARDLARVGKHAGDLVDLVGRARGIAGGTSLASSALGECQVHVTVPAARLVTVAARLLPAGSRARYAEEFRSELWDLAAAGAGRCGQVRYAARQLVCAGPLRLVMLTPRRKKAP